MTIKEAAAMLAEREIAARRVRAFIEKQAGPEEILSAISGAAGSAWDTVKNYAEPAWDTVKNYAEPTIKGVSDFAGKSVGNSALVGGLAGAGGGALLGMGSELMRDPEDRKYSRGLLGGALAGGVTGAGLGGAYSAWNSDANKATVAPEDVAKGKINDRITGLTGGDTPLPATAKTRQEAAADALKTPEENEAELAAGEKAKSSYENNKTLGSTIKNEILATPVDAGARFAVGGAAGAAGAHALNRRPVSAVKALREGANLELGPNGNKNLTPEQKAQLNDIVSYTRQPGPRPNSKPLPDAAQRALESPRFFKSRTSHYTSDIKHPAGYTQGRIQEMRRAGSKSLKSQRTAKLPMTAGGVGGGLLGAFLPYIIEKTLGNSDATRGQLIQHGMEAGQRLQQN